MYSVYKHETKPIKLYGNGQLSLTNWLRLKGTLSFSYEIIGGVSISLIKAWDTNYIIAHCC